MPLRLTAGAAAPEELPRKRWLRGLEATYTEHDFIMSERGLKNHCTGNRAVGSNATLSAILRLK